MKLLGSVCNLIRMTETWGGGHLLTLPTEPLAMGTQPRGGWWIRAILIIWLCYVIVIIMNIKIFHQSELMYFSRIFYIFKYWKRSIFYFIFISYFRVWILYELNGLTNINPRFTVKVSSFFNWDNQFDRYMESHFFRIFIRIFNINYFKFSNTGLELKLKLLKRVT